MELPGLFPIYPDPLLLKYRVSLSLPPIPVGLISKSIGLTASSQFLTPNIEFLEKFIEGDIGISDKILNSSVFNALEGSIATKDEKVFEKFKELSNAKTPDISELKKGKEINISKDQFSLPPIDGMGLKALEKTIITSIFETQKPYFELAKLLLGNISKIEDIVARVMPLLGIPLVTKSLKPQTNSGAKLRPKAIGFNNEDLKKSLKKLEVLSNRGLNFNNDTIVKKDNKNIITGEYINILTSYSTGKFIPGVDYDYTYLDIIDDINIDKQVKDDVDVDIYEKHKPKMIILGIFKSDGTPLNPNDKIKTASINDSNELYYVDTPFKTAEYILNSKKYQNDNIYLSNNIPSFSEPNYVWEKNSSTKISNESPGNGWKIKKYKKGDKNLLDKNIDAIEGNPMISSFNNLEINEYKEYFKDIIKYKMDNSELTQSDKDKYSNDIINRLNIQSHVENVYLYSQNKSSIYKTQIPDLIRKAYKPFRLYSESAIADDNITSYNKKIGIPPGYIWIDPETDYKTKIIRIDPSTKIDFIEAQGEPKYEATIKSFIKNKIVFKISNDMKFNIEISKNNEEYLIYEDVDSYTLENWNYHKPDFTSEPIIQNNNSYNVKMYGNTPHKYYMSRTETIYEKGNSTVKISKQNKKWFYREYNTNDEEIFIKSGIYITQNNEKIEVKNNEIIKWFYFEDILDTNILPKFGIENTIVLNYDSKVDEKKNLISSVSTKSIPLYSMKVENTNFPHGKIIDPSKILNEHLSKYEPYSNGKYGIGNESNPQEIEILKRYMVTDADTESYYIVEGILNEEDTKIEVNEDNDNNWYSLPDAIGAIKPFLLLSVDIATKMFPVIDKILKLCKDPRSLVTEVIKEKLGDGFSIFSKKSFEAFESAKIELDKLSNSKNSIKEKNIKDIFEKSPLKNYVFVNRFGDYKFLLDGVAMIPFSIFGKQLPFGMDLNFSNLPGSPMNLITSNNPSKNKIRNLQELLKPKASINKPSSNTSNYIAKPLDISELKASNKLYNGLDTSNYNISYSTIDFYDNIDYNVIIIDNENVSNMIDKANTILSKSDEEIDINEASKSIEELNNELQKNPSNEVLKNTIIDLKNKLQNSKLNNQPILKMILGMVTLPIKIIASIVEWLMDFLKSLINPLTLPQKMIELLSFKWLLKFFTPLGIMEIAGIKLDPDKLLEYTTMVNIPNLSPPNILPNFNFAYKLNLKLYKDAIPKGRHLFRDDLELVDWNKIVSIPFMSIFPTYTARMHREMPTRPLNFIFSIFSLIEKVINGFIDFIWSLLGIEALIPPPHLKLSSNKKNHSIEDLKKLSEEMKKNEPNIDTKLDIESYINNMEISEEDFVYEIKLDDGSILKNLNYNEMQQYINENNIDYKFNF
jgi:hypothetical protein